MKRIERRDIVVIGVVSKPYHNSNNGRTQRIAVYICLFNYSIDNRAAPDNAPYPTDPSIRIRESEETGQKGKSGTALHEQIRAESAANQMRPECGNRYA